MKQLSWQQLTAAEMSRWHLRKLHRHLARTKAEQTPALGVKQVRNLDFTDLTTETGIGYTSDGIARHVNKSTIAFLLDVGLDTLLLFRVCTRDKNSLLLTGGE